MAEGQASFYSVGAAGCSDVIESAVLESELVVGGPACFLSLQPDAMMMKTAQAARENFMTCCDVELLIDGLNLETWK